jgi:molybdate-binding protein/DNA-binding XRE family transcriptional regulator
VTGRASDLRTLRAARGLTQEALAGQVGISRQAYAAIESGNARPSVDVALRIAAALDASVESLFLPADGSDALTVPFVGALPPAGPFPVRLAELAGRVLAFPTRRRSVLGVASADGTAEPLPNGRVRVALFPSRPASPDLVVVGCDPAFALVAEALRAERGVEVLWVQAGSRAALEMLARGEAHVGGVHLQDHATGEYNAPWVRRLVPWECTLVRFATWEESLLLADGNPLAVKSIADVARPGVRFVNREEGSGSRALVDRSLDELGMTADDIGGYQTTRASGHLEVAGAVASGAADAGVGIHAAGALYGLHAITLGEEPYDLVIPKPLLDLPAVQSLIDVLSRPAVRRQVSALGGYDTSAMGTPG